MQRGSKAELCQRSDWLTQALLEDMDRQRAATGSGSCCRSGCCGTAAFGKGPTAGRRCGFKTYEAMTPCPCPCLPRLNALEAQHPTLSLLKTLSCPNNRFSLALPSCSFTFLSSQSAHHAFRKGRRARHQHHPNPRGMSTSMLLLLLPRYRRIPSQQAAPLSQFFYALAATTPHNDVLYQLLTFALFRRSMPQSRPTLAILAPLWAWPRWPTSSSTSL